MQTRRLQPTKRSQQSLRSLASRELARLRDDGHPISEHKRYYELGLDARAVRNTVRFRTVIHEVGPYVDRKASVLETDETRSASTTEAERDRAFDGKPSLDKEAFAHRYAEERASDLRVRGRIPFEQRPDEDALVYCVPQMAS